MCMDVSEVFVCDNWRPCHHSLQVVIMCFGGGNPAVSKRRRLSVGVEAAPRVARRLPPPRLHLSTPRITKCRFCVIVALTNLDIRARGEQSIHRARISGYTCVAG